MSKKPVTTPRQIDSLKAPTDKIKEFHTIAARGIAKGTLLLKVTNTGTKTFYTRASHIGKRIDIRLGIYPIVVLKDAVTKHNEAMAYIEKGIDPRPLLKAERQQNIDAITMDELFERWFEYALNTSTSKRETLDSHKWRWYDYISPSLGSVLLKDLTRAHLTTTLDKCVKRSREQARKAFTTLNLPLDFALTRSLIVDNPGRTIKPKDFNATKARPRSRRLEVSEIEVLLKTLHSKENQHSPQMLAIIRIALLSGARRGEICKMKWTDLTYDGDTLVWNIPQTKNGRPHRVFLFGYGQSIIESLRPITGRSEWVFESSKIDGKPIRSDAVTTFVRRLNTDSLISHFTLHDLRRTAASYWAEHLKTDTAVIELMLNHLPQNELVRTYQIIKRQEDQKITWKEWDEKVCSISNKCDERRLKVAV